MTTILNERDIKLVRTFLKLYKEGRLTPDFFQGVEEDAEEPTEGEEPEVGDGKGVSIRVSGLTFSIEVMLLGRPPTKEDVEEAKRLVEAVRGDKDVVVR